MRRIRLAVIALVTCLVAVAITGSAAAPATQTTQASAQEITAAKAILDELEASLAERLRYAEHLAAQLEQIAPLVPVQYRMMVIYSSMANGLDPFDLAAVGWVESRWESDAAGSAGEAGIMQIMPDTARWIAQEMGLDTPYDLTDPATSIAFGAFYLRSQLNREGDMDRALAAFNGGPNATEIKPESARAYVDLVRAAQGR